MTQEPLDRQLLLARRRKAILRKGMIRVRAAIPAEERARLTDLVEETLFALPEVSSASTILLFYSFGTEVPTKGMAGRILRAGKRLLLPYVTDTEEMEAAEVLPGDSLEPSGYGPNEPRSRVAVDPGEIDLIIAPGLAFDRDGNRLGYGGGHYDRYLGRTRPKAVRVGVGFSLQMVEQVPVEPGDETVDMVVTDQEAFDVRPVQ
ncbi:MAG: 5-formyltetrahydrofolate cyclo-ligase [Actinomycetota bacterium]